MLQENVNEHECAKSHVYKSLYMTSKFYKSGRSANKALDSFFVSVLGPSSYCKLPARIIVKSIKSLYMEWILARTVFKVKTIKRRFDLQFFGVLILVKYIQLEHAGPPSRIFTRWLNIEEIKNALK